MAKYKCPTLGDCDKANIGEIFERAPGDDLKCPGCGMLLDPVANAVGGMNGNSKLPIIAAGIAAVLILAGGGYYTFRSVKAPKIPVVTQESAAVNPAAAVASDVATTPANPGITPPDAETKALRQESQEKLTSGDAVSAEQVSSKAASNEMLKLAIAKMAQGKLDEAEKDLIEARARDPKQSLVYYNTAILRLKQARVDDALNEFEASFVAGFSYFDQMDQDRDLDSLRKNPRFTNLVTKYRTLAKSAK